MSDNIQTNTTGRLTPCLQKKIDKTTYLVEVHFSDTSTQSVEDKLKRVILHDIKHGKQGKTRKRDEK
ncbi:MAG: transposon-encoded TnpW family protein [Roseburia sp.]|nr:transposon-encoded TnpW family protein [Roseburia sp.]